MRKALFGVSDQIHYCMYGGSKDPCDWSRGVCVVIEAPSSREYPLLLAGIIEYPQPVAWRDDKTEAA